MAASIASGKPSGAAALRSRLKALRAALPADRRAAADRRILAFLRARVHEYLAARAGGAGAPAVLAAFWPMDDEPDLRPALYDWAGDARLAVALPRVAVRAAPLEFRAWTPDAPMEPGAYRIPEPRGTAVVRPDVVLVPALGFTAAGDRVGYGGGYYDRTLAALRSDGRPLLALGVAYACGRLAAGAHRPAPHDAKLDAVVSEEGWTAG